MAPSALLRSVAVVVSGILLVAACGGDDDAEVSADDPTADDDSAADDASSSDIDAEDAGDAITVDTLADSCDRLAPVITSLRGEAPAWVEPVEASTPSVNGETFQSADCHFAYDGDRLADGDFDMDTEDLSDENRLSIRINHADDMTPAEREQMWTVLASTESVSGLGDEAHWYVNDAFGLEANVRVLTGDTVVILSASAPDGLEGATWLARDPMVTALREILTFTER